MRYTVTTFKVRLEVSDLGDRTVASEDVVRVAKPIFANLDADNEHFVVLALNSKNRVNGYKVISTGSLRQLWVRRADVHSGLTFGPSRGGVGSQSFLRRSRAEPGGPRHFAPPKLKECGEMLPIRVVDHVILGADRYYSFSDRGLL